jgi:hypothetical protein
VAVIASDHQRLSIGTYRNGNNLELILSFFDTHESISFFTRFVPAEAFITELVNELGRDYVLNIIEKLDK